jgi:hypothetical protein
MTRPAMTMPSLDVLTLAPAAALPALDALTLAPAAALPALDAITLPLAAAPPFVDTFTLPPAAFTASLGSSAGRPDARTPYAYGSFMGSFGPTRPVATFALVVALAGCNRPRSAPPPSPPMADPGPPVVREDDVTFTPYGFGGAASGDWLCRGSDGIARAHVFAFDNGPDYVSEGFRRYVADGKMGFVDAACHVVIPAAWDFVEPFDGGRARVCMACVKERDGEHWRMVGGRWSFIDRTGRASWLGSDAGP